MNNTSNSSSEESGYYFGMALCLHKPILPASMLHTQCAKEALFWKQKHTWLNAEAFTKSAIDAYEGQASLLAMTR